MARFRNILCVIEPSAGLFADEAGEQADNQAWVLARARALAAGQQARLTILCVLDPVPTVSGVVPQSVERALQERFAEYVSGLLKDLPDGPSPQIRAVFGRSHQEIIREVLRHDYDLVIKPAKADEGVRDRLFGSSDMHLLRKCPVPVWMLKENGAIPYRHIMAAVDFDPASPEMTVPLNRQIVDLAIALALAESAELHLAHVWDVGSDDVLRLWSPEGEVVPASTHVDEERQRHQRWLEQLVDDIAERYGSETFEYLRPQQYLPRGRASREVPALASLLEADLIVMGTVGRSGIPGLLIGNTAETILHKVGSAVLAVKPPGFKTPVEL